MFVEMFEMEIVEKRGLVADGCRQHDSVTTDAMSFYRNNHNAAIMLFPRLTQRYATTTICYHNECIIKMSTNARPTTRLDTSRTPRQHGVSDAMCFYRNNRHAVTSSCDID
jgi:hypothetical protein